MTAAPARPDGTGRPSGRSRAAALVAAAVAGSVLAAPGPAWADGPCPTLDSGVTVVVDFQHLGGGTVVRCAPGDPASGLAALSAAGFAVDQVGSQPGFVCRIDGVPRPAEEDCADTPPASAYWGYSYAQRGGSWAYSGAGAHVRDPEVGTVEGWAFSGDGGSTQPTVAPPAPPAEPTPEPSTPSPPAEPAPPAPSPSPSPTPTPVAPAPSAAPHPSAETSADRDDVTAAGGDGSGGAPGPTEESPQAAGGAGTAVPTDAPSTSPDRASPAGGATAGPSTSAGGGTAGPSTPADGTAEAALAGSAARQGDGSPWGTLAGVGVVVAVLGAAVIVSRRRRSEPT